MERADAPHRGLAFSTASTAVARSCPSQSGKLRLLNGHPCLIWSCGNGALAEELLSWGYDPIGIDPSASGIAQARRRLPSIPFHEATADLAALAQLQLPAFDALLSTEVAK